MDTIGKGGGARGSGAVGALILADPRLGKVTDTQLATSLGVSRASVRVARERLGIPRCGVRASASAPCPRCGAKFPLDGTKASLTKRRAHAAACRAVAVRAALPRGSWRTPADVSALFESVDAAVAAAGWTWADVRAVTRVTRQNVEGWLNGEHGMTLGTLLTIADAFGVPPSQLLKELD